MARIAQDDTTDRNPSVIPAEPVDLARYEALANAKVSFQARRRAALASLGIKA